MRQRLRLKTGRTLTDGEYRSSQSIEQINRFNISNINVVSLQSLWNACSVGFSELSMFRLQLLKFAMVVIAGAPECALPTRLHP